MRAALPGLGERKDPHAGADGAAAAVPVRQGDRDPAVAQQRRVGPLRGERAGGVREDGRVGKGEALSLRLGDDPVLRRDEVFMHGAHVTHRCCEIDLVTGGEAGQVEVGDPNAGAGTLVTVITVTHEGTL